MSPRLWLLDLALRVLVKRKLGKAQDPARLREQFEADAQRLFRQPEDANYIADSLRRDEGEARLNLLWASCGRPDRRRVILYLHGGAYIMGSPQTHRHLAAALARAAGCRALVPDYRLAPEHPFPAGLDDCETAYRHLLDSGYDPGAIALAGDSAGGGLVFALLLRLQRHGLPAPGCAVGFSPWVDMRGTAESIRRNARRDTMLPAKRFGDVVAFYLGPDGLAEAPEASPVLGRFEAPPPALILASSAEILEDDARALAQRLRAGAGDVHLEIWGRLPHAWPVFLGLLRQADTAVTRAGAFIDQQLSRAGPADDTASGDPAG